MKYILCILLLISISVSAQKKWYAPLISKSDAYLYALQFTSGISEGLHEELINHYPAFQKHFPNADSNYWNPKISFKRKYKDFEGGDLRPAFFGSKGIFVSVTDPYHWTNTITHGTNLLSIAIGFGDLKSYRKKDRWKVIAKKLILSSLANRVGFITMYNIIL